MTDTEILNWLDENLLSITHDRVSCSVDMSGNRLSISYENSDGKRVRGRGKSIREIVEKATNYE